MGREQVKCEMPKYKCHKEVWALKIRDIVFTGDSSAAVIKFDDEKYAALKVGADYIRKHQPASGGYYVVYAGGYESFSPADVFEDGYELL